jgi:hypothetical protein
LFLIHILMKGDLSRGLFLGIDLALLRKFF